MKPTILVVDDEKNIRTMLKMYLSNEGYDVEIVEDGEKALNITKERNFDLILLDLKMPKLNGMEVLQKLRDNDNKSNVIMMTAYGTVEDAVSAMKLKALDFISKPFSLDKLKEIIKKVLSRGNIEENKLNSYDDYIEYAKLSIISNDIDKAEEILQKAISKNVSSPVTHNLLGVIYEYKGDILHAQKHYRAALALDPTYEPAENNIKRTVEFDYNLSGIELG